MQYFVEIVCDADGEVVRRLGPMGEREADRVAAGASINLNHEEYTIAVVPVEGER